MREVFQICDLPMGRGWDKTATRLIDEQNLNKDESFDDKIDLLCDYYNNFLLINNKAVRLYLLKRAQIDKWIDAFSSFKPQRTIFHETYPFPVSEDRLNDVDLAPKIVEIKESEESLIIIFCTKRVSVEREEINSRKLSKELRENLERYNKIVGVKEVYRQYFDIIVLSKKDDRVEIRIDMTTGSSSSKDLPSKEIDKAFYQIMKCFNDTAKKFTKTEDTLFTSTNVFQLIDRLYTSQEGKIVELDFATDEGSIKHAKMPKNSIDLRTELFHAAGMGAVSHINPYRLLISWDYQLLVDLNNTLELYLPGSVRELSQVPPYLGHFYVKNCISLKEYNFILNKILTYLKRL